MAFRVPFLGFLLKAPARELARAPHTLDAADTVLHVPDAVVGFRVPGLVPLGYVLFSAARLTTGRDQG